MDLIEGHTLGHTLGPEIKQMLLCTICPFSEQYFSTVFLEASINVNFRSRELKFTNALGTSTSWDISKLRSTEWLGLIGAPYCKLVALMDTISLEPMAIRIYILKEKMMEELADGLCGSNVLSFETILGNTILESSYFIEPEKKRRQVSSDLSIKTLGATATVKICDDLFWSFNDLVFVREAGEIIKIDSKPVALVSDVVDQWKPEILNHMKALAPMYRRAKTTRSASQASSDGLICASGLSLIVTKHVASWTSCATSENFAVIEATNTGISNHFCSMNDAVVIVSPEVLLANIASYQDLMDTLEVALNNTIFTISPRGPQVKRFFTEKLCLKFKNIDVPLNIIQFGSIIIDDIDDPETLDSMNLLEARQAPRWLQIIRDPMNTKPKGLTRDQASLALWGHKKPNNLLPMFLNLIDLTTIGIPKSVLRKFKVFGHLIKNGPVEERISKVFQTRYCPLPLNDSIQRFSGRPVTPAIARDLMLRHQERLATSLGGFLDTANEVTTISSDFANSSLYGPKSCAICFDGLESQFSISICGHVYCKVCCDHQFGLEWSQNKAKDCASCRAPLVYGDVLHVDPTLKDFSPALPSKESCVANFLAGLKGAPVAYLTCLADKKPKHLIITDVGSVSVSEIIQKYRDQSLNIQIFYNQIETSAYQAFIEQF